MDIKALLAQVRQLIGDEAVAKISSVLKEIETGVEDLVDSLKTANTESKNRKIKIRELEDSKSDLEGQLETLKKENNAEELTTLREFKQKSLTSQRESLGKQIETISKHPNFAKAEKLLKLPAADAKGVRDYSKMPDADLEFNVSKLQELNDLDYFGQSDTTKTVHGDKTTVTPQSFQERIKAAKSIKELETIQEEMNNG
jgi:hypothetical protein